MTTTIFSRVSALPAVLEQNTLYIQSVDDAKCRIVIVGTDAGRPKELTVDLSLGAAPIIDDNELQPMDQITEAVYKLQNQILSNKLTTGDILAIPLTSLSVADNSVLVDGDSILAAFGKLQAQVTDIVKATNTSYFLAGASSASPIFVPDAGDQGKVFDLKLSSIKNNPSSLVSLDDGNIVIPDEWVGCPLQVTAYFQGTAAQTNHFSAAVIISTSDDPATFTEKVLVEAAAGNTISTAHVSRIFEVARSTQIKFKYTLTEQEVGNISADGIQIQLRTVQAGPKGSTGSTGLPLNATFTKPVSMVGPAIKKASYNTVAISAGVTVSGAGGTTISFSTDTVATNTTALVVGSNYRVYVTPAGVPMTAISNGTALPASIPGDSVLIGGFHYGAVAQGTTVSSGQFTAVGSGMIWAQSNVNTLIGINEFSIWDQYYRPKCKPEGMTCVKSGDGRGLFWFDIYLTNTNPYALFSSMYDSDICSGTVPPIKPSAFGGDGSTKYGTLNWFNASEVAIACGKRLPSFQEFSASAFGVTEGISIGGSNVTPPKTGRTAGYTSKWGGEQMTGHVWVWGNSAMGSGTPAWTTGVGRGDWYGAPYVPTFGGNRGTAARTGSECAHFGSLPSGSSWAFGLRLYADHFDGSSR